MMKRFFICTMCLHIAAFNLSAQTAKQPSRAVAQQPVAPTPTSSTGRGLLDYGVQVKPDARLILVMAALDAGGFDATPTGVEPNEFRRTARRAYANLDADLRARLTRFVEAQRRRTTDAARLAAPFVSLAFTLGEAPAFDLPTRTDDLPGDVLEVLDFAALAREFYARSNLKTELPQLVKLAQAEADAARPTLASTVSTVITYLRTRPATVVLERINPPAETSKKETQNKNQVVKTRERERRFIVTPDLLGVPHTINFRVIGEDYFLALAPNANPQSSEVRRAYLQFVIDPLVLRFNRQIAERRLDIKQLLDAQIKNAASASSASSASASTLSTSLTDIFPAVTRSLIAAADARIEELTRTNALVQENQARLKPNLSEQEKTAIARLNAEAQQAIRDRTALALSESYERGGVLAFYFAEQLRNLESAGFDIANFLPDIFASFNVAKELTRLTENREARARAERERERTRTERAVETASVAKPTDARELRLTDNLIQVQALLRANRYDQAEARLTQLRAEYNADPRILFALGQVASSSAQDAIDESVRDARLNKAASHYRLAIEVARATGDVESVTNRALLSRAYVALARIYAFQDQAAAAISAFDEAIKIGDVNGGAYREAVSGKAELNAPM